MSTLLQQVNIRQRLCKIKNTNIITSVQFGPVNPIVLHSHLGFPVARSTLHSDHFEQLVFKQESLTEQFLPKE